MYKLNFTPVPLALITLAGAVTAYLLTGLSQTLSPPVPAEIIALHIIAVTLGVAALLALPPIFYSAKWVIRCYDIGIAIMLTGLVAAITVVFVMPR